MCGRPDRPPHANWPRSTRWCPSSHAGWVSVPGLPGPGSYSNPRESSVDSGEVSSRAAILKRVTLKGMFAVYASHPGPADPLGSLVVGEQPDPSPRPGLVPVRVRAASLNMHDVWTLRGDGISSDLFPMIIGCDGAGILEDGTEVVIHSIVNAPDWRGDETLDPKRQNRVPAGHMTLEAHRFADDPLKPCIGGRTEP